MAVPVLACIKTRNASDTKTNRYYMILVIIIKFITTWKIITINIVVIIISSEIRILIKIIVFVTAIVINITY